MSYSSKFWKKSWDKGLKELDPKDYNISYPEIIKQTFVEFPNRPALSFLGIELTFKQVDDYSNQFANMLVKSGFKKGDIVAIALPNTPEYVIALIGTQRAGCIVSGVSPLLSDVQMQYQINDLGAGGKSVCLVTLDAIFAGRLVKIASKLPQLKTVVVTNVANFLPKIKQVLGKLIGKVPKGKITPLPGKEVISMHKDVFVNYSKSFVTVDITPDDISFIQYTGGTTGPPKGAILTHKNIVSNLITIQKWLGWERGKETALSGFPFFHIAGTTFLINCIEHGLMQCLIPNPRDSNHICKEIIKYKPTIMVNVPTLYQILLKNPKFKTLDHSKLKICVSAASPFPAESQRELESVVGKGKLLEMYGMTETAALVTANPSKGPKKLGSIGLPLLNADVKLVDPDTGEEVPLGEPGEILVKGPMNMTGYLNKDEETKKIFESDGFMHTGDVAIMDEEGYMRIVDRTKDMIIVGGFKVFSAKVEDSLSKHPAIAMVALIGTPNPDRPGSEIVKAFVQLDPDYQFDGNETALKDSIIAFAKENCAPYEVPKNIEISADLPLTAVGKIDKKVLRK
ncbi:hypothetical protein LCGC14_1976150 [marine sediment metagenome]|uniref:AMP-dependent synthetase/ligase domain-containing protein n=1 Tax=marine sediment metagenome TaxID=412755 RepID=A0A0F9FAR6_9ZZZZ|nr:AMP-dependent synthetase [bacterium]